MSALPETRRFHVGGVEQITPKIAKEWLSTMVKNRPLSDARMLEYAVAIDKGEWRLNGETIKFDKDGRLFDGQHRLQGCILAEKPFQSFVVRGIVDPHAFSTVDVGKNRSHGDVFGIAGFSNSNLMSSVAMVVYLHSHKMLGWNGVVGAGRKQRTNISDPISQKMKKMPARGSEVQKDELLRFAEPLAEGLSSAVRFAERWKATRLVGRGAVGGAYYLFRDKSFQDAEQFFTDLEEGASLTRKDAVYHLRERLNANAADVAKLSRWTVLGLMFKAWNKRRAHEELRFLRINDGEEFPRKLL